MTSTWQPYREPLRTTLLRTVAIAAAIGAALSASWGGMARWPMATLLALWPAFGGHWVEIVFLNFLRPRLPNARPAQIHARVAVWFAGGILLTLGMRLTAAALTTHRLRLPHWWIGGLAFIVIELIAHLPLQLSGRPSFYNGRG